MSITTPNMSLVKWTEGSDPYDHVQLAGNFQKIDEHDHTTGKGVRLVGGSLVNEAIGTAQIANASVTNAKLAGGITSDKLAAGITGAPGDFKWWWRPNASVALPDAIRWQICAGQTLGSSAHEFEGGGTIILPNLIGRTVFGMEVSGIGVSGGAAAINTFHSHSVNAHTHHINGHSHFLNLETGLNANTNLQVQQNVGGNAWAHTDNANNQAHKHSIGGSSETVELDTNAATATTDGQGGTFSIIPPYYGLLPLMRVKY